MDLISSSFPSFDDQFADLGHKYIMENENRELSRIPSEYEIKEVVWQLHPLKNPGPNGYLRIFYWRYWKSVKDKVIGFVQECFKLGQIPTSANRTYIVLISKVAQAINFNHFRPISLCNFLYKIVAKIIAEIEQGY